MEHPFKPSVIELTKTGFAPTNASIAAHLREQADWFEKSDAIIRNIFMVIEREDGSVYRLTIGQVCDLARAIGVLTMASIQAATGIGEE